MMMMLMKYLLSTLSFNISAGLRLCCRLATVGYPRCLPDTLDTSSPCQTTAKHNPRRKCATKTEKKFCQIAGLAVSGRETGITTLNLPVQIAEAVLVKVWQIA